MIIKTKFFIHAVFLKVRLVVFSLRAQVVDFVMLVVFFSEETLDVLDAVAVPTFDGFGGVAHSYDFVGDVA